jgi:FMN phosphatase YigB (HAD superfamily)
MDKKNPVTTLFLDIGGVMLSNGWGHVSRRSAVDFFISYYFVHFRKSDADIFRIALNIAQVPVQHIVYIEDMQMFVDVASDLGIRSIHHPDYKSTRSQLEMESKQKLKEDIYDNIGGYINIFHKCCPDDYIQFRS